MSRRPGRLGAGLVAGLAALLGIACVASAQAPVHDPARTQGASEELPDVPAGPATLRGRVVHGERPEAAAGVEVALYSLGADGRPGSRRTTSDAEGRFAFEAISNEPGVVYLVGARYADIPFPGERVAFAAGETLRELDIPISDPSEDAGAVRVLRSSLRLSLLGDRLGVAEVHRLHNEGSRVYHVAPARRAGRRAPLQAELLAGATGFAMPLGLVPEGVVLEGGTLRFWGPLYPGEQEISFRYEVPVTPGTATLEKRFPSAAERIRVFALEDGPLEAASGLAPVAAEPDAGTPLLAFETADAGAGFTTALRVRIPEMQADAGAVTLSESQIVMEVDDVRLHAQEQHRIEVAGSAVQHASGDTPLVRFPLPAGAEDLRFSANATGLGLVETEDGVGLVGPLRPGRHDLGISFALPAAGPEGVRFERRFDRRLPLLRVFVADTGVVVETDRLHRRRPVRDADRTYLVYEAFEVEPDERLAFGMRALPTRVGSQRPALLAALLLGLAAVGFLLSPLRGAAEPEAAGDEDEVPATRREREHLYASIRDLDHDYETGKLDRADWEALRSELRERAVALLAEERDRAATAVEKPSVAEPAAPRCPACEADVRAEDRFCSHCGRALGPVGLRRA